MESATRSLPNNLTQGDGGKVAIATSPAQFRARLAALGGFVVAAIATFLPWETGRTSQWYVTENAWDDYVGQGIVILALAAVGLLTLVAPLFYGGLRRINWAQYVSVGAAVLTTIVGVLIYFFDLHQGTFAIPQDTYYANVEIGPYLVIAGGVVATIGSFLGLPERHSKVRSN
jgi:hypothetical protein